MKEICIPIPSFGDQDIAEVSLNVGGKRLNYHFRVESFPWDVSEDEINQEEDASVSLARIYKLKKAIKNYDDGWELIQIYTPNEDAQFIQVLYRKRQE